MTKSAEAFRTISEVASELSVPQHVLRFWETRFSQVRPMKRGGGRRYYRPEDVALLAGIHRLLYADGFTIKGVQKILREHGVHHVAGLAANGASAPIPSVGEAARVAPSIGASGGQAPGASAGLSVGSSVGNGKIVAFGERRGPGANHAEPRRAAGLSTACFLPAARGRSSGRSSRLKPSRRSSTGRAASWSAGRSGPCAIARQRRREL